MKKLNKKRTSKPTFNEEENLWKKGIKHVIGADEVGRGALAGPVVAASVILHRNLPYSLISQINDSKVLSSKKRIELFPIIKEYSVAYSINVVNNSIIDRYGISYATKKAFRKSIKRIMEKISIDINKNSTFLLIDGFCVKYVSKIGLKNQKGIINGDKTSISIAAASIIAKVYRDNLMINLSKKYPGFNWEENKGYGTKIHRNLIKKNGLSLYHRKSFKIKNF
ncbi:MAG: ribonuclease HII [Candidatus Levyibacteriota bacterium]